MHPSPKTCRLPVGPRPAGPTNAASRSGRRQRRRTHGTHRRAGLSPHRSRPRAQVRARGPLGRASVGRRARRGRARSARNQPVGGGTRWDRDAAGGRLRALRPCAGRRRHGGGRRAAASRRRPLRGLPWRRRRATAGDDQMVRHQLPLPRPRARWRRAVRAGRGQMDRPPARGARARPERPAGRARPTVAAAAGQGRSGSPARGCRS